jgi:hypothetical protein
MARIVFLNEKSRLSGNINLFDAGKTFDSFVDLMVELRKLVPRLSLISEDSLPSLALGNSYSVSRWLNDTARERRQFLLSLSSMAPFRSARDLFGDPDPDGVSVYQFDGPPFDGLVVEGIGLADMYGVLAVSFVQDAGWRIENVPVKVEHLTEDQSFNRTGSVAHAACKEHVAKHRDRLLEIARRDIRNADTLWDERADFFPRLRFLPEVLTDLNALQLPAFMQVVNWLFKMNDAVEVWDPSRAPTPQYPPHTTPEHEMRKALFNFRDGVETRCFHMHGRYTPGAGRIHFWLSVAERKVVVGYIGAKLDIALAR